jgi:hypothetical protein
VIDSSSNVVTGIVSTGYDPVAVAVNSVKANYNGNSVTVIGNVSPTFRSFGLLPTPGTNQQRTIFEERMPLVALRVSMTSCDSCTIRA